jgi:hypothetical protein
MLDQRHYMMPGILLRQASKGKNLCRMTRLHGNPPFFIIRESTCTACLIVTNHAVLIPVVRHSSDLLISSA